MNKLGTNIVKMTNLNSFITPKHMHRPDLQNFPK